jgi:hypothetical protein
LKVKGRPNVVCSAVRFLRITIGLKDDMINRQLCHKKAIDMLVEVFTRNGSRYNLLNSAVIEAVHFIRQENIKILVDYLVRNHEVCLLSALCSLFSPLSSLSSLLSTLLLVALLRLVLPSAELTRPPHRISSRG